MNSRALASIALGAAVLLGTTGCSMISTQATKIPYSAAEGINIPDASGPVLIRNAYLVVDEDGNATLVGDFINNTADNQTVSIQVEGLQTVQKLRVEANSVVSLGHDENESVVVENLPMKAGSYAPVYFASGGEQGVRTDIPVLDATLPFLEQYLPTTAP